MTILGGPGGLPWKQNTFQDNFARTLKAAGITDLHFHDIRGTAVTMLSEAGCTVPEIGTITGHSLKEVERISRYIWQEPAPSPKLPSPSLTNTWRTSLQNGLQNGTSGVK